ncbi:MAG: glycine cleavage system protein H [Aerococcus sp.]|nr:glycine cleavage system protein H [Aerococcus sp.]
MAKRGNYLLISEQNNAYTIAMTPELQDDLGTVGYVELTKEDHIDKGGVIANIEASKTVMEIQSPVSGKIVERHEDIEDEPTLLNSAKADENWLIRIAEVDANEYNALEDDE